MKALIIILFMSVMYCYSKDRSSVLVKENGYKLKKRMSKYRRGLPFFEIRFLINCPEVNEKHKDLLRKSRLYRIVGHVLLLLIFLIILFSGM